MKPIKLELSGVNSYSERTEINFEELSKKGLFGIFGNTGSGKSTILDAMTIAMYGYMPENNKEFINTNSDKAFLLYEFEIGNKNSKRRYKINRKMDKCEGNIVNYKALLSEVHNDGSENIIADKIEDVNDKIVQIMGLKAEDFTRAVVLPQGKFNKFLTLEGIERRNMLERIFNLEKYGSSLVSHVEKMKENEIGKLKDISSKLSLYEGVTEELYNTTQDEIERLKELEVGKSRELEWLISIHQEHKDIYEKQSKLEKYHTRMRELDLKRDEIKDKKRKLENAINSNKINPHIKAVQSLEKKINEDSFKLEFTQKKLDILNQELINVKNKYEESYKNKNENMPKLSEEKIKLERAKTLKKDLLTLDKDIKDIKDINELLEREKINLEKNILDLQSKKNTSIKSLKESEDNVDKLKINAELKNKILLAYEYEKEQNRLIEENNFKSNKLEKVIKELEQLNLKVKYIQKDKSIINDKLKKLLEDENNILNKCPGTNDDILSKSNHITDLKYKLNSTKENEIKKEKLQRELNEILENKYRLEREIKGLQESLDNNQRNILDTEKELDKLKYLNLAKELRKELKNNMPCPVCGSRHYEDIISSIKEDDRINIVGKKLNRLIEEETNLKLKLDDLKTRHSMKSSLEKLNQKELEEVRLKLGEVNHNEINNKLNDEVRKLEVLKGNVKRWETEKQNIYINLNKIKDDNYNLEKEEIKLDVVLNNYKQYIEELKSETALLQDNLKNIKEKYLGLKGSIKISNLSEKVDEINKNEKIVEQINEQYLKQIEKKEIIENSLRKVEYQLHEAELKLMKNNEIFIEKRRLKDEKYNEMIAITKGEPIEILLENVEENIKRIISQEEIGKKKLELDRVEYEKYSSEKSNINGGLKISKDEYKIQSDILNQLLIDNKFESIYAVKKAELEPDYLRIIHDEIMEYEEAEKVFNQKIKEFKEALGGRRIKDETFSEVKNNIYNLKVELGRISKEIGANENTLKNLENALEKTKMLNADFNETKLKVDLLEELYKNLDENKFVEFVASEKLKYISIEASEKLEKMTKGKYSLDLDYNLSFVIRDNFNGGKIRSINTLSGGETFLTSLALALALSHQIQLKGNSPLELLFIDEGFGYLDSEILDTVIEYLEGLYDKDLSVGIISHIEELKNRVPVKLLVEGNQIGESSSLRIEYN